MSCSYKPLSDEEISSFLDSIDADKNGQISLNELERHLLEVLDALSPDPKRHHLNSAARQDADLHDFLRSFLPGQHDSVSRADLHQQLKSLNIPSQDQSTEDAAAKAYETKLPLRRRLRAYWSVRGPEYMFLAFVALFTLAFFLWQGLKYVTDPVARRAFGYGVILAKFSAGALYPLFFFLILSMSRWMSTLMRQSYILSRFPNWDFSQAFHIRISILALFFSLLHAIGHLCGTFLLGSQAARQPTIEALFGQPKSYGDYVRSRPGWSGLTALISFILIAITSTPWVRKRSYELFQFTHLLMYLMFAMLALHGTAKLLQSPMLGYFLVFPVLCVFLERLHRTLRGLLPYRARLEALDDGTIVITAERKDGKKWRAHAGQYVLLQVPAISPFQWHPFTVSACVGSRLQVHIKADGDWTKKLHELSSVAKEQDEEYAVIKVGIDGPFGAPAQRFYTFDKAIIVGAGIGVTPFAAILTDLEEAYKTKGDAWALTRTKSFPGRKRTLQRAASRASSDQTRVNVSEKQADNTILRPANEPRQRKKGTRDQRRCDFVWSVREKNDLLWFSDLLNRASALSESDETNLTLNIDAYVTAKRKDLSQHIYRFLLDAYRTDKHPYSALTGLRTAAHFERPDFERIMQNFYQDMTDQDWQGRVGVFYCGPPVIGELLADQCELLTAQARQGSSKMRFIFQNEVFN